MRINHHSRRSHVFRSAHAFCFLGCIIVSSAAFPSPAQESGAANGAFDVPIKKEAVDFGPSPHYQKDPNQPRKTLSCFFYSTILVKQYDEGQKGAEWLAITPVQNGIAPPCTRSHTASERIIDGNEWSGYFKGVKGSFAFFTAADGTDGGLPFAIYDSNTGKKVFEDSAYDWAVWKKKIVDSPFDQLRICMAADGKITLKYLRVVEADCDLHGDRATCWE